MRILFSILLIPLVAATAFGQDCDHSPPQFQSAESSNSKCAYTDDSPISNYVDFFFIQRKYDDYEKLSEYQMTQRVNQSLPTYIIYHGYTSEVGDHPNGWMKETGKKILEHIDANVILIDYGAVSTCNYTFLATELIFKLSEYIADCVMEKWNLSPNQVTVLGHSLGGHIAGLTGSYLNGQVEEIMALDPAGPGFDGQVYGIRQNTLNSSCAQFVQVIHTKTILSGTSRHLGDSDFFANILSRQQPGCGFLDNSCSHSRAHELYFASMFPENKFIGYTSPLSRNLENGSRFGFFNDRKKGTFYFNTTACFGYAK